MATACSNQCTELAVKDSLLARKHCTFINHHTKPGEDVAATVLPTFSLLVDIVQIHQLLESQSRMYGVALALMDEEDNFLVAVGWQDICVRFHRVHPGSADRCRESDAYIKSHLHDLSGEYLEYRCKNGLQDVAMPILINGERAATLFIGQFLCDDDAPDEESFRAQARKFGFDENDYLRALGRVPIFSREQVRNILEYNRTLVQIMAGLGLNNLKLAREVEERKQAEQEASFFRTLIEQTLDPVYAISPSKGYRMAYVNQAACAHFGWSLEELSSMRIPDWDPVFDMGQVDGNLEQLKQGKAMVFETVHRTAAGRLIPVEVSCSYLEHDGEGLTVGHFHDISERKKTEEQILRLNRFYAVLSEANKAIAYSSDRLTLFDEICRVVVEHGGFRLAWIGLVDEASGVVKPVAWRSNGNYCPENLMNSAGDELEGMEAAASAIRDGKLKIIDSFLNDQGAFLRQEELERSPHQSVAAISLKSNGKTVAALTIYAGEKSYFHEGLDELLLQLASDISFALSNLERESHRKKVEMALQRETLQRLRTAEELREKERLLVLQSRQAALGKMLENIAHQWRQPINALGLILQEMPLAHGAGELNGEYLIDAVGRAMDQILHMSQTIDDFRNFFSPDKEKVHFKASQVITKTLSLIAGSLKYPGICVETNIGDDPVITGYPNEYSQVLLNILLNARDVFLERKTASPKISITLGTEQGRSVVTIADNAGGIPDDVIERIFEPYVTTKGPDRGTGVGLFMSKTIIEKNMGGLLSARNNGEGAEFRIEV